MLGAQARVRDVLDIGDHVPVLVELVAEAARLAEVPAAAGVDAVRLVPQRRCVDRGAKLALEEEPLVERNAPGEAGEAVARLAPVLIIAPMLMRGLKNQENHGPPMLLA